jgi:hypothetical protein
MIINSKFFHHPPYISTSWKQVAAVHMSENTLIITLQNADIVRISGLTPKEIDSIFKAHADFLEKESIPWDITAFPTSSSSQNLPPFAQALLSSDITNDSPFRFGIANIDGLASALEHNQAKANMPDLPAEMIQKIAAIAKIVAPTESRDFPKAEPHCNCMYCQIARAIVHGIEGEETLPPPKELERKAVEEVLPYQPWDIQQKGHLMYQVIDKQDPTKKFTVFLGEPMGCTCGQQGCEHLIAVLKS